MPGTIAVLDLSQSRGMPEPWIRRVLKLCLRLYGPAGKKTGKKQRAARPVLRAAEISVLLTDNRGIRRLNAAYRGQNRATDCLSFPAFPAAEIGGLLNSKSRAPVTLGDIVVTVPYARKEARRLKIPFPREMAWLLAHSFLHLMGHDHRTAREEAGMRLLEESYLKEVFQKEP